MSKIYPLYFVYERIFVWMEELYIICRNNILVRYYNILSYTQLHTVLNISLQAKKLRYILIDKAA